MAWGIAIQVDLIAPEVDYVAPRRLREDGLSEEIFRPKKLEGEPETLEGRCFACALKRR